MGHLCKNHIIRIYDRKMITLICIVLLFKLAFFKVFKEIMQEKMNIGNKK